MSALSAEIEQAVSVATEPLRVQLSELTDLLRKTIEGNQSPFVTVQEAAEILSCSEKTILRKFTKGQYEIKRTGRKILIPRDAVLSIQPQG